MCNGIGLRLILSLCCLSCLAVGDSSTRAPRPVLTGTVNVVLANANGIVVLTDSNQTARFPAGEPFTSPFPGQKLFRIDDKTVCTIAGFGSTSLPNFPEFASSAAGVLDRYVEELRSKGGEHGFHEKLTSLYFAFEFQLAGIGNIQQLEQARLGDYGLELILAGYDLDGTVKLGKIVLSTSLNPNGIFSPVLKQLTETTVGPQLAHETAGIGGAAVENILAYPAQFPDELAIQRYATSKASDHGRSLTTAEMEDLARSLARHSAFVNSRYVGGFRKVWWPVGGRDQVAILERGSIQKIDQQWFEERNANTTSFGMIIGLRLDASGLLVSLFTTPPGVLALYLKDWFLGGLVHLDNAYYFGNHFTNATFYYDGGVLGFDTSNQVVDCVLSLGPHVDRKSPAVQELITRFPWKTVNSAN